jgi:uncharacterized protein (DUF2164 family)
MNEINKKYAEINELKAMLVNTDYHVIKEAEGDYSVPQEILDARALARAKINLLEEEIVVLEEELKNNIEEVIEL